MWHVGKPFSSADVKTSLEKIYNPKPGIISLRKDTLASIKSVETPDEGRVVIKLKQPSASLLLNLSAGWNVIYPKHILDVKGTMQKDINGTGPFKMGEYVRGVEWTQERNPEYFKKGLPYLDGLKYYIILDQASRFAALRTKRVHATGIGMEILPDEITIIQREAPEIVIQKHWMLFWAGINLPLHRFPWSDIRARQALSLAFNREEAWNVVDYGWGLKGGVMATQGEWGLPQDKLETIPGYGPWKESNIAEAKKLLKDVGVPDGFKAVLLVRQGEDYVKLAVVMQNVLAKLGIQATL
ncbi:MAG: ABC transporter substrate-binding protein, partial [Chloroflexota bacterium]|nr:ABC transporter substrate-binding protein [Chloroflexota bacterium]